MATGGSSPPKSLRKSQRSNTNLIRQSLSPQKIHAILVHKNYKLNAEVAIIKKKIHCFSKPHVIDNSQNEVEVRYKIHNTRKN